MEILKGQFEESLSHICNTIAQADFISIDAEFSGLSLPNAMTKAQDDLQIRYEKMSRSVEAYSIVQFGVCAFRKTAKGFVASPYNFYIFGNDTDTIRSNRQFTSSASSLAFLRENRFDFNKLIDHGIPFYNFAEEAASHSNAGGTQMGRKPFDFGRLNKSMRTFLENTRAQITNWLQNEGAKPLVVSCNSATQRRVLYQEIQDPRYNGFLQAQSRDTKNIEIKKIQAEDRLKSGDHSPALNFRHVIEAMKNAKCPVVIHNGLFDVMHTVDQFWHNLPEGISDFKKMVLGMWHQTVDTKYMAEFHPLLRSCFNTSVLGTLYITVEAELRGQGHTIRMAKGFDRYKDNLESQHEAGYDAYMTGVVYLGFIYYIKERQGKNCDGEVDSVLTLKFLEEAKKRGEAEAIEDDNEDDLFTSKSLTPYYNKIYVMRSDMPYLDLEKSETLAGNIQRNRFYLRSIPTGMSYSSLERLYPELLPFNASWVNEKEAWITLRNHEKIELVKLGMLGRERVRPFLKDGPRCIEGEAFSIRSDAGSMELLTGEQWEQLKVQEENIKELAMKNSEAPNVNASDEGSPEPSMGPEPNASQVPRNTALPLVDQAIPNGASDFGDIDLLPTSLTGTKRKTDEDGPDNKKPKH
ncbi:CAF1-domain-containing protein [Hesseltinella vesiculosa]|uniref:CAF1-domain-containing protein n=1 Tax=Hesseltinella vesiculosa TaxID=101127 RepID=A0A1X2GJM3_9FUNG|nr:CAF1-domain-containing protein [Hesseltinella vesiculosa]